MAKSKANIGSNTGQVMISSYFSQSPKASPAKTHHRSSTPIDLTVDSDEDERPAKKKRKMSSFFTTNAANTSSSSTTVQPSQHVENENAVEQYRFDPDNASIARIQTASQEAARKQRLERGKRILLYDDSVLAQHEQDEQGMPEDGEGDEPGDESGVDEPEDEVDANFRAAMALFQASSSSKSKRSKRKNVTVTEPAAKRKKATEIGPSGEAYTALELQLHSVDDMDPTAVPPLVCLIEELRGGMGADERVCISMISICASTGDVIWDQFEATYPDNPLKTRLVHITPSELLLSEDGLSKSTEKMLNHFTSALKARIDAVEEIMSTYSAKLTVLRNVLKGLPDLARGLCRIQYGKCTPQELAILLPAFNKVATCFNPVDTPDQAGFQSLILNEILYTMPKLRGPIKDALDAISLTVAKEGKKESMWSNEDKFPEIEGIKVSIQVVESELVDELRKIRRYLKRPALQYSTVAGEEYVLELKKSELKEVPARWTVVSATKYMRRLRSPEIIEKLQQRAQWKEALDAEANRAYRSFLEDISQHHYGLLRDAVNKLASADCLLSLAILASQQDFVRPQFSDDDVLEIVAGRHPMVEALRDSPFVPNTVQLDPRHQVITGPNMGGKSSVVRMIALCIIMAIAGAVLQHLVQQTKCKTLFITHYPDVAEDLERKFPMEVQNMHMAYTEDLRIDGTRDVTFLYKLTSGITTNSFGVECARLAGIPESVLRIATHRAETMRALIAERSRKNKLRKALRLAQNTMKLPPSDALASSLDELHTLVSSMSV
ncbi:hypothetical protein PHLCEN_2v2052 [Hermanssonia centrifuga]|uniref:MutS protein homolog 3 n=1 Tax=Hermanssonia centrifuga TaxID=98765 RepID=A0A2R6RQ93_9APHY|nr:hypothetical protein PHLCEN_2v2052 [Hermanssonia centrifuga]